MLIHEKGRLTCFKEAEPEPCFPGSLSSNFTNHYFPEALLGNGIEGFGNVKFHNVERGSPFVSNSRQFAKGEKQLNSLLTFACPLVLAAIL